MVGKQAPIRADFQPESTLNIFQPTRSKSVPDIRESKPEAPFQRFQSRVYNSTLQFPGPSAFFVTPIGPHQPLASQSLGCIFGGQVFTPASSQEKYLTAHVSISTHFSRPHEFEDLQKPHLRRSAEFFFYPQSKSIHKRVETNKSLQHEVELCSTSTGLTNILAAQPQDLSPSIEDLTLIKDPEEPSMAVPTQYDIEHQLNGQNDHTVVITKRIASFSDLKRKFEDANTMYLPRDLTVLRECPGPVRRDRRSQSIGALKSRPRSAVYESLSPIKRPESLRSLSLERDSPTKISNGSSRNCVLERRRNPQEIGQRWSMPQTSRRFDGYSPTRRKLVGINRNASPRSMNRAAGCNDWPDGIFTKAGNVYKRINNNGISYIIPTSPELLSYPRSVDYRKDQLTVDCSDHYTVRSPSPRMRDRSSPCLNYSYLEHTDRSGQKPYRSVTLSEWKAIPVERKYASCLNLNRPETYRVKRYSVPRADLSEEDAWKIRAQEISEGRKMIHTVRGSYSPVPLYSPPRIIPGDLEEVTEREVRERVALRERRRLSPRQEYPLPSPTSSSYYLPQDGIDETSISRKFDSNIALFEQLAVESKREALCSKCSGCCIHSPGARQPYSSRRLFSTRRTQAPHEYPLDGGTQPMKYRFERGGFDRYYGNGTVEVISSPGGRMFSRSFDPYPSS
ncbi:unnamed protein product [Hymenolepis diminuta]|uniref:PH domain-containing protein n=2 Tax=Hymenolepis diminuta TaxID=6216 RepID=A0A0R3SS52_HYMDI|nr:unnamed protein product [Hymenolepis diminuta]